MEWKNKFNCSHGIECNTPTKMNATALIFFFKLGLKKNSYQQIDKKHQYGKDT